WTNQRLVPIAQADHPAPGPALDLITQPLELNLTGSYDVGPGLIPGHVVDATGAPLAYNGPNAIRLDRGSMTLEFLAPTPSHLETLAFNVGVQGPLVRGTMPFQADVFDWTNGTWHRLDSSAIRPDSTLSSLPPQNVAGGRGAVVAAPPAPAVGGSQFGVTQAISVAGGGQYVIAVDGPDRDQYVAPTGLVRLRISSENGSLSVGSASLIARGSPSAFRA